MNLKERNETKIEASINSLKATNSVVTTIYSLVSISIFTILSFVIRCLKRHRSAIVILESSFKLIQTIVNEELKKNMSIDSDAPLLNGIYIFN